MKRASSTGFTCTASWRWTAATYALLEPVDGDGSLTVLRIEGDVETGNLVTLDDDEWERVAEALEEEDYVVLDDEEDDLDAFDDEDDDVEDDEDDEEEELDI